MAAERFMARHCTWRTSQPASASVATDSDGTTYEAGVNFMPSARIGSADWYFEGGETMPNRTADIQQILSSEDPEFREWVEEHHSCEARLNELTAREEISVDEEMEEKTLKKRKLHLKDRMADRIRSYEASHASV
jgi:uncharacterized protein YdcH (DUF465 family)